MTISAMLDACVLYPVYLCDTFLRLAEADLFRPQWSAEIVNEVRRNLVARGVPENAVDRRMAAMDRYFPDASITEFETLIEEMTNDPKDRHVLAAAVRGQAAVVVTFNVSDFPTPALKPFEVIAMHPDDVWVGEAPR